MANLSVAVITYNEERNIARCLDSVSDIADEIVIIDSYSTDQTVTIAEKHGAVVFSRPFSGYRDQKNMALARTSHPLVLSLDADEALTPELKASIAHIKANPQKDAYTFNRLTNFCGKWIYHSGWYPDKKLRLFDKRKASWGGENIHEKVVLQEGTKTGHLEGNLLHYSFSSIEEHVSQINKFSSLKAKVLFQKGKRTGVAKMLFSPFVKFFRHYILKAGFLDGFYGFVISKNSAHSVFLKYAKLREMNRPKQ